MTLKVQQHAKERENIERLGGGVVDKINWDAWLTAYVVLFYKCK